MAAKVIDDPAAGEVLLVKSPRSRRISIRVHPVRGVTVTLPRFCSYADGERVFAQKREWVLETLRRLPELDRRGRTFLTAQAGLGTEGLTLEWFAVQPDRTLRLGYIRDQDQQLVLFDRDFSLCKEDQPALDRPEGGACFYFALELEDTSDVEQQV